ncbi:hypothetical protein AB834_05135 [PVC group bacterium (ex Bugula neritina AB1)]|nr:hypothetical protein AB834_05135 [PVC group bacterium (ex Bugula neritina AB1)]
MLALKKRSLSTFALLSFIFVGIFFIWEELFFGILFGIACLGFYEIWKISDSKMTWKSFGVACVIGAFFMRSGLAWSLILTIILIQSFFLFYLYDRNSLKGAFSLLTSQVLSFLYVFCFAKAVWHTKLLYGGEFWLVWVILTVKFGDISAYLVGSKWGKNKLHAVLSPAKTWEGSFANLLTSIVVGPLIWGLFYPKELSFLAVFLLSIGVNVLGQLGDLWESMLKRDYGVKDSGKWIPGMGGVLDVVDSLAFSFPLVCIVLEGVVT